MKKIGYLITWNDPTYRGKTTLSKDPCHKDEGVCEPVFLVSDLKEPTDLMLEAAAFAIRHGASMRELVRDVLSAIRIELK